MEDGKSYRQYNLTTYHSLDTVDQSEETMSPISVCKRATNTYIIDQMIQQMQEIKLNNDDISSPYILNSECDNINDGTTAAVNNPTILLDKLTITEEKYNDLAKGITDGASCIVSDISFNPNSPIGPIGTSAVILAPTDTSERAQCLEGTNWITGTKEDQLAYRSKLGGIIAGLTIIDTVLQYKNISEGTVEIALDNNSAIDKVEATPR